MVNQVSEAGKIQLSEQRQKLLDIERGKGIGILLVVYGHLVMDRTLDEKAWYYYSKSIIYLFHMPLFMYFSGFVFFHTNAHRAFEGEYFKYFMKRFDRLLVPFAVLAFVIVLGKALASNILYLDDSVGGFWEGMLAVLTNGPKNPSISIWYLLVLFVYSIAVPVLWRIVGQRLIILLLIGIVVHFIPVSEDFYIGRIFRFFVFFIVGMCVCKYSDVMFRFFKNYFVLFLVAFCVSLWIGRSNPYWLLLCGLTSIPVIHGFVRFAIFDREKILVFLGQNSMVIYLLNTIFIGVAKAVYVKTMPYDGPWFAVLIAILMIAGTGLPLIVREVARRLEFARIFYRYIR